jgi:hypothetical protein
MSEPTFTERQAKAWEEDVRPVLVRHGIDGLRSWNLHWAEEVRPGRGHFLNATYVDGEHFAQVLMDVYGSPTVSVAELNWVHADSDEEMECRTCDEVSSDD